MPTEARKSEKPSAKFRAAMRQILSVPKSELIRREAEYKKARRTTNGRDK
jgi:hypothetical protein